MTRSEAIKAAPRAGAIVQGKPGRETDVLGRGRPNKLQIAGSPGGTKLMEVRRLADQGHPVTVISGRQFWKLDAAPREAVDRRRSTRFRSLWRRV